MKVKRYKVGEKVIDFITLSELAKLSGKETNTLQKWEEKRWLPLANFNDTSITLKDNTIRKGARLYSIKYATLMAEHIKKVKKGIAIDNEIKRQLYILSKQENQEYLQIKS